MDTLPMPLDQLAAEHGGLQDFRITAPAEILAVLKQLNDGSAVLNLNGSDGTAYKTTLWAVDAARRVISFAADADSGPLQSLLEAEEAVVVAYVDSIKLQFDAQDLVLVRGDKTSVLNCALPREVFRFQRRSGFRVRPLLRNSPMARLRHPMIPDMSLNLRVLDVSIGGCALFLPSDVPAIDPGVVVNGVQIELDMDTRITLSLRMQHVTCVTPDAQGVRMGCEIVNPGPDVLRLLQRYIDQTQKRQRLLVPPK
jgi:c-di-GMP-binding flagellar brake protein YcgR